MQELRVLGVDDWALKKGQNYGTILVDLEKRKPIDLLVGREAAPFEEWLKVHPEIEIILIRPHTPKIIKEGLLVCR